MTSKRQLEAQLRDEQAKTDSAKELAEVQARNVTRLTRKVNAHRRVVIEHIRACQEFPDDDRLQTLTVALITELDLAGLNISGEVRATPKASTP